MTSSPHVPPWVTSNQSLSYFYLIYAAAFPPSIGMIYWTRYQLFKYQLTGLGTGMIDWKGIGTEIHALPDNAQEYAGTTSLDRTSIHTNLY